MRALILSCNTGEGHNAAGRAMLEKMQSLGIPCEMKDTLSLAGPTVSRKVDKTYVGVTTRVPVVFGAMYGVASVISSSKHHSPVYFANRLYRNRLKEYIETNGFDTVIMPHLFPAQAVTAIKAEGPVSFRSIAVATDYTCIPFWEETRMDAFVIPHQSLTDEFVSRGIDRNIVHPFGIPVREEFYHKQPKEEARRQLNLEQNTPTVLIMSGSMGFGHLEALVGQLLRVYGTSIQIVVLSGTNQKEQMQAVDRLLRYPSYAKGMRDAQRLNMPKDAAGNLIRLLESGF